MTEQRTAIIREICRTEGHGRIVDITNPLAFPVHRALREVICQRGCGAQIVDLLDTHTFAEIQAVLDRLGADSTAEFDRGRITIWPDQQKSAAVVLPGQHGTEERQ